MSGVLAGLPWVSRQSVVVKIEDGVTHTERKTYVTCPECSAIVIEEDQRSDSLRGGGYYSFAQCAKCGWTDEDGDGWSADEDGMAGYDDFCDSEYHRAYPDAHHTDSLCHNCQENTAQDKAMLCRSCEVEIYGQEQADAYRARRQQVSA